MAVVAAVGAVIAPASGEEAPGDLEVVEQELPRQLHRVVLQHRVAFVTAFQRHEAG
eukprot:CAMPEP_0171126450 /NCGR_PEP_ID=MMETSP0766_2-20121228/113303_1 /TAXON_ID=439317 /ORGANISM="Gambierdiscus australes, Strain CAWD 149" /LENGTH=55 /DNA_ID=CAMNT_0011589495 /DNA_START=115 /DNA_END=278 /DNA_ORIENTATION=+